MNKDTMKKLNNDVVDPPLDDGEGDKKKRGLVGIRYNATAIVAWNLCDNKNIRVDARKVSERAWHIDGYVADKLRITATVFGGKHATIRYVKSIRNGLTSRAMRLKHNHNRRAANPSNPSNPSNLSNPTNPKEK